MSLQVNLGWLVGVLLVSIRVASAIAFIPVFGPAQIPAPIKVILAVGMSTLLVSAQAFAMPVITTNTALLVAAVHEAIVGASIASGFLIAYAATQIAGRALDIQIGFGAAAVLNPAAPGLAPLLGTLFGMSMIAAFLALDGHHVLLLAVSASLDAFPPASLRHGDWSLLILQSGVMFTFALAFSAPVMFSLWLSDAAMAVFARSMPQLNVFVLSFAVKILIGLAGLALSIGLTRTFFDGLFNSTFRYWDHVSVER